MARVVERIPVRDGSDEEVTLAFTRHGPVICEDVSGRQAFAVRTVWSEPGTAAYLGSLAYLGATTVTEFREALRDWSAPSTNQVLCGYRWHHRMVHGRQGARAPELGRAAPGDR